jgi:beta-glucosidase
VLVPPPNPVRRFAHNPPPLQRAAIVPLAVLALTQALGLSTGSRAQAHAQAQPQPAIGVRSRAVLSVDGLRFKDANGSGQLDPYEDWRRPVEARVRDLVGRMTLEEKAGLMLIDTLNAGCGGALTPAATAFVETQRMSRFVLRNVVKEGDVATPPRPRRFASIAVSPRQMANSPTPVRRSPGPAAGHPVVSRDAPAATTRPIRAGTRRAPARSRSSQKKPDCRRRAVSARWRQSRR